jgi:membrane protein DedA with SNARE-associated domain
VLESLQAWVANLYAHIDYPQIFVLMALESSLFPVPSELVMMPAGYLARSGRLDVFMVALVGGAGSIVGAWFNYLVGRYLGRAFLLRYGRYVLVPESKYHEAEALFLRNAYVATFFGRFLPVIRHLISLPAGVFGMHRLAFTLLTGLGATIWCGVLAGTGYLFGQEAIHIVQTYTHLIGLGAVALMLIGVGWFLFHRAR